MGMIIDPHEIYFGTFFGRFNMRFGPPQGGGHPPWGGGGINEVAVLQKEFEIFRTGRPFLDSAALLGLGGLVSSPAKDRWLEYLARLPKMQSNDPNASGDEHIVASLLRNFTRRQPLPCYMQAVDGRLSEPGLVTVTETTPLFYLESVKFLTISLPMRPATPSKRAAPRAPRSTGRRRAARK